MKNKEVAYLSFSATGSNKKGWYDKRIPVGLRTEYLARYNNQLGIWDNLAIINAWSEIEDSIKGVRLRIVSVLKGELSKDFDFNGLIIGSSANSVYESLPWIEETKVFVRQCIEKEIPTLGICFGHQMIAEICGGHVMKAAKKEVGTTSILLTDKGKNDPLFAGLSDIFLAQENHCDIVTDINGISDVACLAESEHSTNQSLAIGGSIRTVQFHPEWDDLNMKKVIYRNREGNEMMGLDSRQLLSEVRQTDAGVKILKNFVDKFVAK